MMMVLLQQFYYEQYNSNDSWLPFWIPMTIWAGSYLYCRFCHKKYEFHKWYFIHNLHNFGAILIGCLSIYYSDDHVKERISCLWSMSYFIIDILDCTLRRDVTYFWHGIFCFGLGYNNYRDPILSTVLRMNSKATFCELSNPFMHLAKRSRKPYHFLLFAIVFTLCRIVWIPYLCYQLYCQPSVTIATYPLTYVALLAFYVLNWTWYVKILRILYNGFIGKPSEKEQ